MDKVAGGVIKLRNGALLPRMGFGTFRCTGDSTVENSIDCALGCGYRLIDTAHLYTNEQQIGDALKKLLPKHNLHREDIFLTTKLQVSPDPIDKVVASLKASLTKLQTNYIDLALIHYPKPFMVESDTNPEYKQWRKTAWLALEQMCDSGEIRSIGISNYEPRHIDELKEYARIQPVVNQCECHPHLSRETLRKHCALNDIHFQAFTSLGRNDPNLIGVPLFAEIAKRHGATVQQVLLAWALAQDISVVPKSQTAERIKSNFDAINVKLTDEEVKSMNALNCDTSYTKCRPWNVQ